MKNLLKSTILYKENNPQQTLIKSIHWRLLCKRTTGIEPAFPAWKAGALAVVLHPHNTINIMLWRGAESNRRHYELQSYALPTELPRQNKTVTTGFEPVIFRVTGERHNQLDHATNR